MSEGGDRAPRGRVALHGGGEFEPGDEPFLDALLTAVRAPAAGDAMRIVVVPTAAGRERPTASAKHGIGAFTRAAKRLGIAALPAAALVVDRASAEDPSLAASLEAADLVYLPGGHPDLVPAVLEGTLAWRSILAMLAGGGVLAGASAGAMGLATRTWTPGGWLPGLGLVPGLFVVPHFAMFGSDPDAWAGAIAELEAAGLGRLGLDERTGVISNEGLAGNWQVAGEGRAHWFPLGGGEPVVAGHGETLRLVSPAPAG